MGKIVGPAQAVAANDKGRRRLKTYQGQVIELERDQAYRSHCEVTSFPSGRGTRAAGRGVYAADAGDDSAAGEPDAVPGGGQGRQVQSSHAGV
jgi:hypothetical protein